MTDAFDPDGVASGILGVATLAGHSFTLAHRVAGVVTLRIALGGASLTALATALASLDGVRVTGGPGGADRARGYLVHCAGFKMVLASSAGGVGGLADEAGDFAVGLVSRTPPPALAVMSDLGVVLDRLMSEPPQLQPPQPPPPPPPPPPQLPPQLPRQLIDVAARRPRAPGRSRLQPGKPLARKTELRRKTPLSRGRFR